MGIPIRVLIVEDSTDDAELVLRQLRRAGYDPVSERVETAEAMKTALEREPWDLVVSDYSMPRFDAPTALHLLNQSGRDVPFIVVSGSIGEDIAVAMMKTGAHDYVLKQNLTRFVSAVQRELREAENRRQQQLTEQAKQRLQLERDDLLERLKQENEDLAALTQVTANAISTLDLDDVLRVLLGRVVDVMHADTATILLADGAELRVRASAGVVDFGDSTHVARVGEGFAGSVASRMKPVYVEDAAVDPLITDPLIRERGIRSMLGVPLKRNGTLIGVLHVDWLTVRPCRDREVHLLEITAERCAAAIQNAQLYQQAKQLAATLTASEARLRRIVESDMIGLQFWDAAGGITDANDAFLRIVGYTRDDIRAGRVRWRDMTPPEYRSRDDNAQRELDTTGVSPPFEKEYVRKDGTRVPVLVGGATFPNLPGQGVAFVLDITEEHRVQRALAGTVEMLERTGDMAKVGGWELDLRTMKLFWSLATCRIHEVDPPVAPELEEGIDLYFPPEARPIIRAAMRAAIDNGTPYDLELPKITAKGRPIWVRVQGSAVMENGKAIKLLGAFHDITERKQAEAELRLLSAALNAAANSIVITDRNGTVEWVNPAYTALTGYGAKDAIGKNQRDLVYSGVHGEPFYRELWDTILAGDVWHGEMTNRRKDGSLYIVDQTITSVKNTRGEFAHFIVIQRDLTEQKRLEAQFLQAQKMEVVGRLASGIAHDFNNLLTVINGTASLALTDLKQDDSRRADLLQIHAAGDRAAVLTQQLLAFSRKQIMKTTALNLSALVADLRGMLQRLIGEGITLVVNPAKDVGSVMADAGQIEQVVMNLAVNARDAMPRGGTLTIETREVALDEAFAAEHPSVQPGPHVMLAISDTGDGMDEATRTQIFEPFFTTKALGKGTGLGLSTVYGIVKQSGGSILVNSELGKGTTFTIYLPRVEAVARKSPPGSIAITVSGTETVLIVEDEELVCRLAERVLQMAGYTVLTASSGGEALALLERHDGPVHLVLTDMVMPGMSGRDLATQMKDLHLRTKVLYTSGYTDDAILHHGLPDEVTHFIGKPYSIAELARKVREVLDS